jgi:hypothetical protein
MTVAAALALAIQLLNAARAAGLAGRTEITEAELDVALAEIDASDDALTDAIERARNRP